MTEGGSPAPQRFGPPVCCGGLGSCWFPRRDRGAADRSPLGLLAELASGLLLEPIAPLDHPGDPFRFITYQTSAAYRPAEEAGVLDHIPTFYVQVSELLVPDNALPADAVLVQVSRSTDRSRARSSIKSPSTLSR